MTAQPGPEGRGSPLRHGIYLPNFGVFADPRVVVELAEVAEASGWHGLYLWDHLLFDLASCPPVADPWVTLSAVAMATQRLRLGTTVTPLARRRPWVLARQTVTLDHLSGGRLTLGVGLGDPPDADFAAFGEDPDPRHRAARLDEGLQVLTGLWSGDRFRFAGSVYRIEDVGFRPTPLQRPRIPIWVGGIWPHRAPFRRAARWDGVFPIAADGRIDGTRLTAILEYVTARRAPGAPPLEVAVQGTTGSDPARDAEHLAELRAAGLTWWLERLDTERGSLAELRARVRAGPPVR